MRFHWIIGLQEVQQLDTNNGALTEIINIARLNPTICIIVVKFPLLSRACVFHNFQFISFRSTWTSGHGHISCQLLTTQFQCSVSWVYILKIICSLFSCSACFASCCVWLLWISLISRQIPQVTLRRREIRTLPRMQNKKSLFSYSYSYLLSYYPYAHSFPHSFSYYFHIHINISQQYLAKFMQSLNWLMLVS